MILTSRIVEGLFTAAMLAALVWAVRLWASHPERRWPAVLLLAALEHATGPATA